MGVYQVHPIPPIGLSASSNPSVGGSPVTISAHITGNCNVPTGSVTFLDGTAVLGTVLLDAQANASLTTSTLTVGSHHITASYPGDFNFDASVATPYVQVVTGYPTATVLLGVSPNPAKALQAISFTAAVSPRPSHVSPRPTTSPSWPSPERTQHSQ